MSIVLTDAFTGTTIDVAKWNVASVATGLSLAGTTTQNNQLSVVTSNTNNTSSGVVSVNSFNFAGGFAQVKVPQVASGTTPDTVLFMFLDGSNWVRIVHENGVLYAQKSVATTVTTFNSVSYNATNHLYWRIAFHSGGTLDFQTSPDASTWTTFAAVGAPGFSISSVKFGLQGEAHAASASATALFDDFTYDDGSAGSIVASPSSVQTGVSVTVSLVGSGTTWTSGTAFTYRGSAVTSKTFTDSTHYSVTFTTGSETSGAISDGTSSVTVTVNNQIAANDSHIYWSPGNVFFTSGAATVIDNGTYLKGGFSGTSLSLILDLTAFRSNSIAVGNWGGFTCMIDGAVASYAALTDPGVNSLTYVVATGLASGNHTYEIWRTTFYYIGADQWTPKDCVVVSKLAIDNTAALINPSGLVAIKTNTAMVIGDSITYDGYSYNEAIAGAASGALVTYPPTGFAQLLAHGLDAEVGQIGKSSQGWSRTGLPTNTGGLFFPGTWNLICAGQSRSFTGLKYLIVCHGTNDSTNDITSIVQTWLSAARAAIPSTCWIVLVQPFTFGQHNAEINAATAAYQTANPSDTKVVVVDSGSVAPFTTDLGSGLNTFYKRDGTHPNTQGHIVLGAALSGLISRATAAGGGGSTVITKRAAARRGRN